VTLKAAHTFLNRNCVQPDGKFAFGNVDFSVGVGVSHQAREAPTHNVSTPYDGSLADDLRSGG
jgi:hypothetical protein